MKTIMLVASFLLVSCVGRAPGDYPGRPDGTSPVITDEAFASRNGSRLRAYTGWRCADGAETVTGGLFDTRTGARCYLSGTDTGYCTPLGVPADPARDVRCDAVLMP
jgi:hypothetical protein